MANSTDPSADGRALRSARSRGAIVQALFDLVGEGVPMPTAQQVAERAQVGIRTVFRHFSDMETLFAELDSHLRSAVAPLASEMPRGGSVEQRAREMVRRRAKVYERIAPYKRASALMQWRSPFLEEQHRKLVRDLRRELERCLPELASAPEELADALELVTSFEAWNRLRVEQGLGAKRASTALERAVMPLVDALAD